MEVSPFGQDTDGGAKPQCPEIFLQSLMGRTGNSCMQFVNALGIAEKLGGATFTIKSDLMHEDHKMRNIFDFSTDDIKFHVKPNPTAQRACKTDTAFRFKPDFIPSDVGGENMQEDVRELKLSFKGDTDNAVADPLLGMGRKLWKQLATKPEYAKNIRTLTFSTPKQAKRAFWRMIQMAQTWGVVSKQWDGKFPTRAEPLVWTPNDGRVVHVNDIGNATTRQQILLAGTVSDCTSGFWDMRCKYGFEHRTRLMQEYLYPYIHPELKKCAKQFGDVSKETLVIHLRGHDVNTYTKDFHPCHAQPACSMYDDVIQRSKIPYKRIIIASDGSHPCVDTITKKFNNTGRTVALSSRGDMFYDACALLGAKNVVWGRSGFSAMFMMLNPDRDQVYLPLAHPGAGDDTADYCDVWNLNHGICNYVKEGYFYYPTEWHGKKTTMDAFGGTCSKNSLGKEPERKLRKQRAK